MTTLKDLGAFLAQFVGEFVGDSIPRVPRSARASGFETLEMRRLARGRPA